MHIPTLLFATSLLLLAIFFAIKEYEAYRSRHTLATRVFVYASPLAERVWQRIRGVVAHVIKTLIVIVGERLRLVIMRLGVTARYLVVVMAEKMVKAVRGERFLSMRGAPSVFLKRLSEEETKS